MQQRPEVQIRLTPLLLQLKPPGKPPPPKGLPCCWPAPCSMPSGPTCGRSGVRSCCCARRCSLQAAQDARLVIDGALLGLLQRVIRLGHLLKLFLRLLVALPCSRCAVSDRRPTCSSVSGACAHRVVVWVVLLRQLVVRLLDLPIRGSPLHSQHVVVVALGQGRCSTLRKPA